MDHKVIVSALASLPGVSAKKEVFSVSTGHELSILVASEGCGSLVDRIEKLELGAGFAVCNCHGGLVVCVEFAAIQLIRCKAPPKQGPSRAGFGR